MCARFHEIPTKRLQGIKETKCYGRTDVKTVYPPYNFVIAGSIIIIFCHHLAKSVELLFAELGSTQSEEFLNQDQAPRF